jgi:hypothetical protein
LTVRAAGPEDAGLILELVRELAVFERAPDSVAATAEDYRRELASAQPGFGCPRLELSVLDWNPARRFYEGLGFRWKHDWLGYRLDGDRLAALAAAAP